MIDGPASGRGGRREPVCYVISGDLAHIGPKFGDPGRVSRTAAGRQPGRRTRP